MRSAIALVTCLTLASVAEGRAQTDSLAAVARDRYRRAVQAADAGALAQARDLMVEAHRAWPTQIAYLTAAARLSARLADTAATAQWLGAIVELGLTTPLDGDSALAAVARAPALAAVTRQIRANAEPLAAGRTLVTDAPADFYPEGVDFDPQSNEWLLASIRKRTVVRVRADGRIAPFARSANPPLDAVLAVRVDRARDRVWVTTRVLPAMEGYRPGQPNRARVVALNRTTGEMIAAADAPEDGAPHLFGDLVIHRSGVAYFTDSESPVLYRATLSEGHVAIEVVAKHRLFRSLQGLAFDDSGERLYLADYSHGLLEVDPATGTVRHLPPPPGTSLLGIDGMVWKDNSLIAIQNGVSPARVLRVRLSGGQVDRVEVLDRNPAVADEPTIGTLAGDQFVYVANSQWEKYQDDGRLKPGARLVAPILIAVPLRP